MSWTANVFTDTVIASAKLLEKDILITSRMTELQQDIVAGSAILNNQDPNIVINGFGESCIAADIYTLRSASMLAADKTLACAVGTGVKAGSEKISLTKEVLTKVARFQIDEIRCNNAVTFAQELAYGMAKAKATLETELSKVLVAAVVAGADDIVADQFLTPGAIVGVDTYEIAPADFTSAVLSDMLWYSRLENMVDPIILNGRNLWDAARLAEFESMGCCTTNKALMGDALFKLYWDSKNVDSVTGKRSSLLIDKNAILFWSSPFYSNMGIQTAMTAGREALDRYHYVDTLPRLQYYANGRLNPIYVDVRMELSCLADSTGIPRNAWKFELFLGGAIQLNLLNQDNKQGIVHVVQSASA